jgi:hypothetical protein
MEYNSNLVLRSYDRRHSSISFPDIPSSEKSFHKRKINEKKIRKKEMY